LPPISSDTFLKRVATEAAIAAPVRVEPGERDRAARRGGRPAPARPSARARARG
jgi:hypothetical protein